MKKYSFGSAEALLFDLGGVVIDYDFDIVFTRWAKYANRNFADIQSRFSFDHAFEAFERGEIEAADYFNRLRTMLGIDISDRQFEDGWNAVYKGVIPGMPDLLKFACKELPLYAFTNSNHTHKKVWSKKFSETLSLFKTVFNSSDIGKRKPEPEAFQLIADATGVDFHQMVFYDDLLENINGAKNVGLNTVHVLSISDVASSFEKLFKCSFIP